ncbi:hypothetical protein BH20ACT23_BH20ACT23_23600 [soil metagenome]
MSDTLNSLDRTIEGSFAGQVSSRRRFVGLAAASLGSLGLLGAAPRTAWAKGESTQKILNVAATAEVLATIVNTVGFTKGLGGDAVTTRNLAAAAREELLHFRALRSFGGKPAARRIWVPDAVFASREALLSTLEVGDQIFVNAYLVATHAFGTRGQGDLATIAAEFMGVEAVHRALARQSLGKLGNDRIFMKFDQVEMAPDAPNRGQRGFGNLDGAVRQLLQAGFGIGAKGASPGRFYDFDEVKKDTPNDPDLNTRMPRA